MKKFYTIKQKDASNPYELILLIANFLPKSQVLIESSFAKSQGIQETLYSVDFADCEAFEELLSHSWGIPWTGVGYSPWAHKQLDKTE